MQFTLAAAAALFGASALAAPASPGSTGAPPDPNILYHELGLAVGFYGTGEILTHCRAGGLGDVICQQQNPTTIVIDSLPDAPAQA
ncbi:Effector protein PevD1 like [Verticillium longisporum]|nr:Effector protein PevD1 like [Verticillium longisporum]